MSAQFHRILCPIDFDDNSMAALQSAAELARSADATLFVLHVVPMVIPPAGMPIYVDIYRGQETDAKARLAEIARKMLAGIKYELMTHIGEPAPSILAVRRKVAADLIVISTHGRHGLSHFFLGSVAEEIIRKSTCAVLTVKRTAPNKETVDAWMTRNPVTAAPTDVLSLVQVKMHEGGFRCVPIVDKGGLVGIVTDSDLRQRYGQLAETAASSAMSEPPISITPDTPILEASRLLRERKIGALPVVENGQLVGVVTTTDVLHALAGEE
jgi:nucleotide-binding universal stress UspA family protein